MPFLRKRGENIVEPDRPQMAIWRMCITCWVPKSTNTHTHTHSEYVILIAFPLQRWFHKGPSLLHYTYFARLLILYWRRRLFSVRYNLKVNFCYCQASCLISKCTGFQSVLSGSQWIHDSFPEGSVIHLL